MTLSLDGRLALREVIEQAWHEVEGQRGECCSELWRTLVGGTGPAVSEASSGRESVPLGLHSAEMLDHAVGSLEQVRVPRLRGQEEIGLIERYERHGLDQMLFALTVGGLSQRKVVVGAAVLGGTLSPASIGAVLQQAQQQVQQRRSEAIPRGAIGYRGGRMYLRYRRSVTRPRAKGAAGGGGVREGGEFEVLDWRAAAAESTEEYEELLTRLWKRGWRR